MGESGVFVGFLRGVFGRRILVWWGFLRYRRPLFIIFELTTTLLKDEYFEDRSIFRRTLLQKINLMTTPLPIKINPTTTPTDQNQEKLFYSKIKITLSKKEI